MNMNIIRKHRGGCQKEQAGKYPLGDGKVIELLPLKGSVIVALEEGNRAEFTKEEVESVGSQRQKAKPPRDSEEKPESD